jgi:putative peptide zinc metalloprotease protein
MRRVENTPNKDQAGGRKELAATPVRPALAPNVQLAGELKETGFTESQWLIERDGRFIQLTELLYRLLEQMNGERTLEEVAAKSTESTEWLVSADDVRYLLESKLIPMGLVVAEEQTAAPSDRSEGRGSSPLAFGMRVRLLGPRAMRPVIKVLQALFAPFVFVPMLVAIVLVHAWVYLSHGVWGGIEDVLRTPGLLLVVLAMALAAGIFHEFGHASALRYGGGEPQEMGAGIYLIYPAFYTDTTDNYRLGRWARVRTDVGGFYFYLIFTLGVIALFFVTGQQFEFLLFFVLLINLNIVYQCLPVVRFDGYWALADLTGIPDFFSQMGAFLRSALPVPGWKGAKLPNLKPWVKGVFTAYTIVTVPVLVGLLYLFVTRLPAIVTTAWHSLLGQASKFSQALEAGSYLGMVTSFTQASILALQMLGVAYLLYSLARIVAVSVWKRVGVAHRPEGEGA